jgi:hypothetical protein
MTDFNISCICFMVKSYAILKNKLKIFNYLCEKNSHCSTKLNTGQS